MYNDEIEEALAAALSFEAQGFEETAHALREVAEAAMRSALKPSLLGCSSEADVTER